MKSSNGILASFTIRSFASLGLIPLLFAQSSLAQTKVLIDFGNVDSFRGASVVGVDSNGNTWNSIKAGVYWANLTNTSGTPTTVGLNIIADGGTDSYNGPAGDTTIGSGDTNLDINKIQNAQIDSVSLGVLGGAKEAAFDFFASSVFVLEQLNPRRKYRLTFFGSKKYNTDATTVYTVYDSNPGDIANTSGANVLSSANLYVNNGPIPGGAAWQHNSNRVASVTIANRSSVHVGFVDANGTSAGYLNAMSIEEVAFSPAGGRAVLLDFGSSTNTSTPFAAQIGPDNNGRYWNGVAYGYVAGLVDTANQPTSFAYAPDGSTDAGGFNGPAGVTSNPPTSAQIDAALAAVNPTLLGPLGGSGAAVLDFFGNPRFQIQGLNPSKKYQLAFFGSKKYAAETTSRYSIHTDSSYSSEQAFVESFHGINGDHNDGAVAVLDDVSPQSNGILYVSVAGAAGGTGYLNAMMIVEKDTTPPVITLANPNTLRVNLNSTFTDPGATVTDDVDAARSIQGTGTVDTAVAGIYTRIYQASDSAGNAATPVTRTVLVSRPVIETVRIDFGRDTTYRGVTTPGNWNSVGFGYVANLTNSLGNATLIDYAPDRLGNTDSFNTIVGATSDPLSPAEISAADAALNKTALGELGVAEAAIDFFKSDNGTTGVGRFQLQQLRKGRDYLLTFYGTKQYVAAGNEQTRFKVFTNPDYTNAVATVDLTTGTTNGDGNRSRVAVLPGLIGPDNTNNILYVQWEGVNVSTEGYLSSMLVQELETPDTVAPQLTLLGDNPITVAQNSPFTDPGAAFTDNMDADRVVFSSDSVNTSAVGDVTISYSAQDEAGNAATTITRTVSVVASSDPLATWLAGSPTNSQTLGKYAIGGASSVSGSSEAPVMSSSSNTLSLTAIVRKASANTNLTVSAEWATSLNNPSWSNQGVTSDATGLTQPTDSELERRKFSVPYDPATEPRKFLRLKAVLTP